MWQKTFRFLVFNSIYNQIFLTREEGVLGSYSQDLHSLALSSLHDPDVVIKSEIEKRLNKFQEEGKENTDFLKKFLPKWDQTYPIVKAILFTFLLEKQEVEDANQIIGKYIKLTQDMIGGENTSLVHAVLAKVAGENKADL